MNVPLIVAGSLSTIAAAIHGAGGELLVVRKLRKTLPSTHFGGPGMTMAMIRVTWHITTAAFLTVGAALIAAGSILEGEVGRAVGILAACASTAFGAIALGAVVANPGAVARHRGPIILAAIPVLAWFGLA